MAAQVVMMGTEGRSTAPRRRRAAAIKPSSVLASGNGRRPLLLRHVRPCYSPTFTAKSASRITRAARIPVAGAIVEVARCGGEVLGVSGCVRRDVRGGRSSFIICVAFRVMMDDSCYRCVCVLDTPACKRFILSDQSAFFAKKRDARKTRSAASNPALTQKLAAQRCAATPAKCGAPSRTAPKNHAIGHVIVMSS